jgi:hypothetical protein
MEVVFKHMGSTFGMDVWDGSKVIKCLQNDTISNTMHLSLSHEHPTKKWVVVNFDF